MTQKYSDETKAAVMAALLTGQSVSAVAREYALPKGTVSSWKDRAHSAVEVAKVATERDPKSDNEQRAKIGDLLLVFLETEILALIAQARVFADAEWLKKQPAAEVAVLHGVSADKAFRLLEALNDDGAAAGKSA